MNSGEDFLEVMGRASRERARRLVAAGHPRELRRQALSMPPPPPLRLSETGFDVIAEIKMSSPSAGRLSGDVASIEGRAVGYAEAGACAVSVLTEPERFGGDLQHLTQAARALASRSVPAMAKDFLVAPEQVWQARAAGAGGVLLIIRMLDDKRLGEMLDIALDTGMFVLLEAFDGDDLLRIASLTARRSGNGGTILTGLNCRDLRSLEVDPARFERLAGEFPAGFPKVAESGIESAEDAAAVAALGYSVALIGTALMRTDQPGELLARILRAGRSGRGRP